MGEHWHVTFPHLPDGHSSPCLGTPCTALTCLSQGNTWLAPALPQSLLSFAFRERVLCTLVLQGGTKFSALNWRTTSYAGASSNLSGMQLSYPSTPTQALILGLPVCPATSLSSQPPCCLPSWCLTPVCPLTLITLALFANEIGVKFSFITCGIRIPRGGQWLAWC